MSKTSVPNGKPPLNSNLSLLGSFMSDGRTRLQISSIKMVEHSLPSERLFVCLFVFLMGFITKREQVTEQEMLGSLQCSGALASWLSLLQACFMIVSKSLTCHLSLFISRTNVCVRL